MPPAEDRPRRLVAETPAPVRLDSASIPTPIARAPAERREQYNPPAVFDDHRPLFEAATQGDHHALDDLLKRYLPQLQTFVRARLGRMIRARESSIDVVQSVCRELLSARASFSFQGEELFRAWLFTSALNKLRERHRRMHAEKRAVSREVDAEAPDSFVAVARSMTPSQDAIGNEIAAALRDTLNELTEAHREVLTLARIARLPHRVIAKVMDRTEEATRQLLARATLQLARGLKRRGVRLEPAEPR